MAKSTLAKSLRIGIRCALLEMAANKFRTILNMAGIACSIGALGAMLSIQEGARRSMQKTVADMGGVARIGMQSKPPSDVEEEIVFSRSTGQRVSDADTINSAGKAMVSAFKAYQTRLDVDYRGVAWSAEVRGVDKLALEEGETIQLQEGRFFLPYEYARGDRVATVGWLVAERLALEDRERPGGRNRRDEPFLLLSGQRYSIVGVFTKKNRQWEAAGQMIYIPIRAMEKDFSGSNPRTEWLILDVGDPALDKERSQAIAETMAKSHRGARDIVFRFFEWVDDYRRTMGNLQIVFGIIGGVAFFVGGANIFNLMLSTVTERLKEIGIRKSLGASSFHILLQFISESVTLSLCGGAVGTVIAFFPVVFAAHVERATGGIRPHLDSGSLSLIVALIIALGILSGIYPAWKAARLNPIEALQQE